MKTVTNITAGLACAVMFGTLAASGVPTRMNPPPEPHWRQLPQAQPIAQYHQDRLAEAGPMDLSPDIETARLDDDRWEQHEARLATLVQPEFVELNLDDIGMTEHEPLPPMPQERADNSMVGYVAPAETRAQRSALAASDTAAAVRTALAEGVPSRR